jgi:putative ABC transport system permease protein
VLSLRVALRRVARRPGGTIVAIILLGVGVGLSTAGFALAYGVLLRRLPYPDADRLAVIWQVTKGEPAQLSYLDFSTLRRSHAFNATAAIGGGRGTLTAGGSVDRVNALDVDPELLGTMGATPAAGRLLTSDDAGRPHAVISHRLWTTFFGGATEAIGRTFDLSGRAYTIVGVLPAGVDFEMPMSNGLTIAPNDVWTVLNPTDPLATNRSISTYQAIVRLATGVSLEEAQAGVDVSAAALAREYPATNADRTFRVVTLRDQIVGRTREAVVLLFCAGAMMLLTSCANLAGMSLARLPSRRREIDVRRALGATQGRLIRESLLESLSIAIPGGALGFILAWGAVGAVTSTPELQLVRVGSVRIDAAAGAFAVAATLAVAVLLALLAGRFAGSIAEGLRGGGRGSCGTGRQWQRMLVAAEVAIAVVLVCGAALLGISLIRLLQIDPGFDPSRSFAIRVSAYAARHPGRTEVATFFRDVVARIERLPGVETATASSALPMSGQLTMTGVRLEGAAADPSASMGAGWQTVMPGFFRTTRVRIVSGRDFVLQDVSRTPHVVVINEALARRLFPQGSPIGRRVALGPPPHDDWHEIIGVVGDVRHAGLGVPAMPRAYDLFGQHWGRTMYVVGRAASEDPARLASSMRRAVAEVDEQAPVFEASTLEGLVSRSVAARRLSAILAIAFAAAALFLAAIGIYGVVAASVSERTRELAVRMALGARRGHIMRLVLGEGFSMAAAGLATGAAGTIVAGRFLEAYLVGVSAADISVLSSVTAVLIVATTLALVPPIRRALGMNVVESLKTD